MRRIDELHLDYPFAGARMLRDLLRREGVAVGRRHVATLMKRMGIEALYRRPNTSKPAPGHKIYPYLLRGVTIDRPNHVWAMDISYIPMGAASSISRRSSTWFEPARAGASRVDQHGGGVLRRGARRGAGETRQARHFQYGSGQPVHQPRLHRVLLDTKIAISMDGKGAWRDNVFVERLWRSVKYEEVYLRAYDSVSEARASISRYLAFYNERRPHSSLDGRAPDEAYFGIRETAMAA